MKWWWITRFKKELNPEYTWVAGYSNDVFAYIPSLRILREEDMKRGAMLYYGRPGKFTESVEETIVRAVHQLIDLRKNARRLGGIRVMP